MTDQNSQVLAKPTLAQDVEQGVALYVDCRNKLRAMQEQHDAEQKVWKDRLALLSGWLMKHLEDTNSESVKTASGTFYQSTKHTASLADPDAFMKFVIDNKAFDLLDRRANATAVKAYVAEHKALPPGVNMSAIKTIGVRAPTGKNAD